MFAIQLKIYISMPTTLEKKILEEELIRSSLIPILVDLPTTGKIDAQKEKEQKEEVSELTPAIMDLIIQQNLG